MEELKYPIGIQDFERIRKGGYVYIDKTEYIFKFLETGASYVFLARPRRFGKSLFVSTLEAFFSGKKELFQGLAIDRPETQWETYPVLHFDMSDAKHVDEERLVNMLNYKLAFYEKQYGIENPAPDHNLRLCALIVTAYEKTGKPVVVLIDEYDAPLLDVVHEKGLLDKLRNIMRNFYSPLKSHGRYLRFLFLTGITKFSQVSIFSELNNLKIISMVEKYGAICGITEEEIRKYLWQGVEAFAQKIGTDAESAMDKLKKMYDGYHFTYPSPDIYNPFSLLNALDDQQPDESYWFSSGTPTYLLEMMRKFQTQPSEIGEMQALKDDFDAPTEKMTSILPLLYQSGYLTIKGYEPRRSRYTLDIPNEEVRIGLFKSLLPSYVQSESKTKNMVADIADCLDADDMDGALKLLQAFLKTVPYTDNTNYEGHYQQLLFVIFSLLGMYVDVEVRTPTGRVDMVLKTATRLYVMELKMSSADEAMAQIDLKDYPSRFALSGLPVTKVAAAFDMETHTLSEWKIE